MNDDLVRLLAAADASAPPPPGAAITEATLAARLAARRRRVAVRVALAVAAAALLFATWPRPEPQHKARPAPSPTVADLLAQATALRDAFAALPDPIPVDRSTAQAAAAWRLELATVRGDAALAYHSSLEKSK